MCRFLTDLLNPEGTHGCGTLFLKYFLEDVLNIYQTSDTLLSHTDVIKEFVIDNELRIDIVIRNAFFYSDRGQAIHRGTGGTMLRLLCVRCIHCPSYIHRLSDPVWNHTFTVQQEA